MLLNLSARMSSIMCILLKIPFSDQFGGGLFLPPLDGGRNPPAGGGSSLPACHPCQSLKLPARYPCPSLNCLVLLPYPSSSLYSLKSIRAPTSSTLSTKVTFIISFKIILTAPIVIERRGREKKKLNEKNLMENIKQNKMRRHFNLIITICFKKIHTFAEP